MSTKQSILLAFVILALFSMFLFIIFGDNGLADLHLLKIEKDKLVKENAELNQENLALYREIERLKNDLSFLESVARQELGVIGKDEIILKLNKKKEKKELEE